MRLRSGLIGVLALAMTSGVVPAQDAPFYKGKQIRLVISTGVAGGYAEYARVLAEYWGRHIAGQPSFLVQSMPGAGGLSATNYLYAQAPQDGTTVGIVHSTVPLAPLWGSRGVRFETLKFNWLGALDRAEGMCITWRTSPVRTWTDLLTRDSTVGSSGVGSQMDTYPAMLNKLFGTRMKVIGGYKAGTDIYLAMERGEVDGRCGGQLTVIKATRPDWLTEKKIHVPIIIAEKQSTVFPDSPTIMQFVKDDGVRRQLELVMLGQTMDRPVLAPPGVPELRVRELREALAAVVRDDAFRAEIERRNLHIDLVSGEEMTRRLERAFASPPDVIAAARETMGGR
jgi:tripartite-type tricarboxylate transporter receptor subunit TctC